MKKIDKILNKNFLKKEYIKYKKSIVKISQETGFCQSVISDRLKKYGIEIRKGRLSHKYKDYTNKKIGKLKVLRESRDGKNKLIWICKCDCGKEKKVYPGHFVAGLKSCGCADIRKFGKVGNIPYWYINRLKKSDIENKHDIRGEFTVSMQYLDNLWIKQNGKCALSGIEIKLSDTQMKRAECTASLDRIDSNKGHIEGNVQWVHRDINLMKNHFNQEYFLEICNTIHLYNRK